MSGEKNSDISNTIQVSSSEGNHEQATDLPRRPSQQPKVIDQRDTDDTTYFYNTNKDHVRPLTPEMEGKLIRKNFWFLLIQTWWISFLIHLDKSTLSSASTMGIFDDVKMTKNEYNQLFMLFYAGYLIALWPGAWISQRVGHKYFITGSLFLWALLLGIHPAVKTGKQMMAVRFLLGMVCFDSSPGIRKIWINNKRIDRITDCAFYRRSSPSILPTKKEPMGSVTMVGLWESSQCYVDHDIL
jgi:hypothetical protein